jgi:hypothetical protein
MTTPEGSLMAAHHPEDRHHLFVAGVNAHDVDAL